jgi:hypothetical protein
MMECELCSHECDESEMDVIIIRGIMYWACPDCKWLEEMQ